MKRNDEEQRRTVRGDELREKQRREAKTRKQNKTTGKREQIENQKYEHREREKKKKKMKEKYRQN